MIYDSLAFFIHQQNNAMMKNSIPFLISLLSLISTQVEASNNLIDQVQVCKNIIENNQRLNCFDQIKVSDNTAAVETQTNVEASKFPNLIANLDEPNLSISYGKLDFLGVNKNAVLLSGGIRQAINTFNWLDERPLSLNIVAQIRSQFDVNEIDTRNNRGGALINTDFTIGGEIVQSLDAWNWRFSYSHRSTHLGDEFLIDNPEYLGNRINLSYENIQWTAQTNLNGWDLYAGLGYITRSEPGQLDKSMWQLGWQYEGNNWHNIKPIWAVDLKSWGAYDWNINLSMRAGIEVSEWTHTPFQILFEYQDGHSPYGQFFTEDLTFTGLTLLQRW